MTTDELVLHNCAEVTADVFQQETGAVAKRRRWRRLRSVHKHTCRSVNRKGNNRRTTWYQTWSTTCAHWSPSSMPKQTVPSVDKRISFSLRPPSVIILPLLTGDRWQSSSGYLSDTPFIDWCTAWQLGQCCQHSGGVPLGSSICVSCPPTVPLSWLSLRIREACDFCDVKVTPSHIRGCWVF